jgi:GT2 family glycosyltransferase
MLEFANRLSARGHDVTFYLPDDQALRCDWMRCDARIAPISAGLADRLDVLLFTHEPQWHLLERFASARRRVFYVLHYGRLYGKEGSWESIRAPVDLQLANSSWTADQVEVEIGHRPTVQLGGVNRDVFRPYGGRKQYQLLCMGGKHRDWKGTDTIRAAARRAGVRAEEYAPKDLDQPALGREYDAARVFAVGSWFEGFCQPGLEALACGVPLVTTDNGGCREYAIDGKTALVVPPRDADARLDVVDSDFDWEQRTDELAERLDGVAAGAALAPPPPPPVPPDDPDLSIVVLAWDNLRYTQLFVESVRQHTHVPFELVIVDNGSAWEAASYAAAAADTAVLNDRNLGFATGMNQGLAAARGGYVAFCNNDTILPAGWADRLLETASAHPNAGIVVPALTQARNDVTVRSKPGTAVEVLAPFSAPPAAVVYVMPADVVRNLGAWGEEYEIASGEDVDLAFKVWTNELDIVYDQRVLVQHIGKGSASRLDDWRGLWQRNRRRFLDKWMSDAQTPRLATCPPERFDRNRAIARATAQWMDRYFTTRDKLPKPGLLARGGLVHRRLHRWSRTGWRRVRPHLPPRIVRAVSRARVVRRSPTH